jgi:glycosyltransferase involved in cell wall biosynthesis
MAEDWERTFTVFTATHNRRHTLPRVYESLALQSFPDFEWLIVDDGSADATGRDVTVWQGRAAFPIRYLWQEHSGLHFALNRGVREAHGEFFLPLDSDDALVPHALERLKHHWDCIPVDQRISFSGVCCLCQDENGDLIGRRFPKDVMDSNSLEMKYKYRVTGQKGGFHRTRVMGEFPLDETDAMGSNPWHRIARKYGLRFVNEALEVYYQEAPESSLSRGKRVNRPVTGLYRNADVLNEEIDWLWFWPHAFVRAAVQYVRFSFHCGNGIKEQIKGLRNLRGRLLALATFLAGYLVYRRDMAHGAAVRRIAVSPDNEHTF